MLVQQCVRLLLGDKQTGMCICECVRIQSLFAQPKI